MKTELLANGSPSLPVPLGFPMPAYPSLDSLPTSFLVTNYFPKSLFMHQLLSLMARPPLPPQLRPTSPFVHAQGFSKHTCVLGAAGQAHVFWDAVCTLSLRKGRSGALQCEAAPKPKPSTSVSLETGPCNRLFNLSTIHNFYDNIGFIDSAPPNPKIQGPPLKISDIEDEEEAQ